MISNIVWLVLVGGALLLSVITLVDALVDLAAVPPDQRMHRIVAQIGVRNELVRVGIFLVLAERGISIDDAVRWHGYAIVLLLVIALIWNRIDRKRLLR